MATGGVHSLMIQKALDLSLGRRHSTSGVSRVNIKHFGLVGPKVDGTYWPHRASNLHNPLALGIGWSFTYCNAFNQYTMYTFYTYSAGSEL